MDFDSTMTPEQKTAIPSQRKRRRPALSCAECRRRKIKCDRMVPCNPCKQAKSATCTYSPEGLASKTQMHGNPQPVTASNDILPDTLTASLKNAIEIHFQNESSPDGGPNLYGHNSPGRSTTSSHESRNVQGLVDRVQRLESMLASTSIDEREKSMRISQEPAKDLRGNLAKTRWFGPSHWMQAVAQARKIMCFEFNVDLGDIKLKDKGADMELNVLLQRCKAMARVIKAAEAPQWSLWGTTYKHSLPTREVTDKLVDNYLRTHESHYRILHIPSFKKEYAQFWESPESASPTSTIKIMLCAAIGVCFYQDEDFESVRANVAQWIYVAQQWLASPNEKARLHTSLIQIQCLSLLARGLHGVDGDMTWMSVGSILRTAIKMGYHRDPKYFPRFSQLHGEIRRRLWLTLLELNLQYSLDSGMSPQISVNDYDTELPANINDEDISEATITRPASEPQEVFTQTSMQLRIFSSFRTRLEACTMINDFRFEPSYDEVLRLSALIIKSYKETRTYVYHVSQSSVYHKPTLLQRKILDLIIQGFLLALHRPFAMRARSDPRYYYSHKIYVESALAVMSHLDDPLPPTPPSLSTKSEKVPVDDYARLRVVSRGFLKEVIVHAVVVIYLEELFPLDDFMPAALEDSISHSGPGKTPRPRFRKFIEEAVELAAQRIELGETNVKGHVTFSIALAQIDAAANGEDIEDAIIGAVRDSTIKCEKLLAKRMPREVPMDGLADMGASGMGGMFNAQDVDLAMQDWGMMDFESAAGESWLFPAWAQDENQELMALLRVIWSRQDDFMKLKQLAQQSKGT